MIFEIPIRIAEVSAEIAIQIAKGAKESPEGRMEIWCKSNRSRQELFKEFLVARFGFVRYSLRLAVNESSAL